MNVLVCSMESPGFVYQAIGLAKAIEARGHRATCVASASTANTFAAHGVERIPTPGTDGNSFRLVLWGSVEATLLQLRHIKHAVRTVRPDVIVGSPLGYGPAIAAELLGVPLVMIGGVTFLWEPGMWRHTEGLSWYRSSREALGLTPVSDADADGYPPWLGRRFVLQSTPSLTGPQRWPRFDWVGDASWDPPRASDPELVAWLDAAQRGGRRIVYVQMGREFGQQPLIAYLDEAGRRLDLAFAVSTGHGDREPSVTSDVLWARPFVPRATVLPRAALVIGSGQPTTLLGALTHDLPCVLYYTGSGTEEAAEACRARGVALTARLEDATPDHVVEIITRALADGELHRAASRLGSELRAAGGLDAVAGIVIEHGRGPRRAGAAATAIRP